jgi:hypothetical protein
VGPARAQQGRDRVRRSPRPRRDHAGRLRPRGQRVGLRHRRELSARVGHRHSWRGREPRQEREPEAPHGRDRDPRDRAHRLQQSRDAALRDRRRHRDGRGKTPSIQVLGPASRPAPAHAPGASPHQPDGAPLLRRPGLPRARDALHGEVHARRRAKLPRAVAASTRASSTRSPRARSSSSSSTWWRASTATSRS